MDLVSQGFHSLGTEASCSEWIMFGRGEQPLPSNSWDVCCLCATADPSLGSQALCSQPVEVTTWRTRILEAEGNFTALQRCWPSGAAGLHPPAQCAAELHPDSHLLSPKSALLVSEETLRASSSSTGLEGMEELGSISGSRASSVPCPAHCWRGGGLAAGV